MLNHSQKINKPKIFLLIVLISGCSLNRSPQWGLPVQLGQTSTEVRKVLGRPTEVVDAKTMKKYDIDWDGEYAIEYFYSSGIVGRFDHRKLFAITINTYSDYPGFLLYTGPIVNDVTIKDAKADVIEKLGKPTKIESDSLEPATDPNIPVVWPKMSHYFWRFEGFAVQVDFVNQAQSIDDRKAIVRPKDAIAFIQVYK
jgi:hypothetical protein